MLDLVLPERFRKRLKIVVDDFEDIADWLPFRRVVIVNKHSLASLRQLIEHVIDNFVFFLFRNLVEQEETADEVVFTFILADKTGGIAADDLGPFHSTQFALSMLNLDRRHVRQVKRPLRSDFLRGPSNQIAIHVRELPDTHTGLDFVQIGSHQALVIQEEKDSNDPVVIQCPHPLRVDIRPVVHFGHVRRDAIVVGVNGKRRVVLGHFSIL